MTLAVPQITPTGNAAPVQDLNLRPFQRVTAEILQVSSAQAVLSIDGYPVVARLSSPQQAAELLAQKSARFFVSQMDEETIVLKLIQPETTAVTSEAVVVPVKDLASRLLEQNGMQVNPANLMLTRAALSQRLPASAELLHDLSQALSGIENWGQSEADLAAAIKAAGLPLSPSTINLVNRSGIQLGESLGEIIQMLQNANSKGDISAEARHMVQSNLQMLEEIIPDLGNSANQVAGNLQLYTRLLGRSLENILKDGIQNPGPLWPDKSLLSLARLQQVLRQSGATELGESINKFLEDVHQNLLLNARPDPVPAKGEWAQLSFILKAPNSVSEDDNLNARLKVSRQSAQKKSINPDYTHLIIQVDVKPNKLMQVDLSLAGHQIRASVTAPDGVLCQRAKEELPGLESSLTQLGYSLKDARFDIGKLTVMNGLQVSTGGCSSFTVVDVEA